MHIFIWSLSVLETLKLYSYDVIMFSVENRVDILILYILLSSVSKLHMQSFPKKNVTFVVKVAGFFFSR